ncbi:MAG: hypothetical protein R2939_02605 [Kofleriaceae bacterium]
MSGRRELVLGHSVNGQPIEAVHFTPPSYAQPGCRRCSSAPSTATSR